MDLTYRDLLLRTESMPSRNSAPLLGFVVAMVAALVLWIAAGWAAIRLLT
jgi:hypothetical protein